MTRYLNIGLPPLGKAKILINNYGAELVAIIKANCTMHGNVPKIEDAPKGKVLVVVCENGSFDAAALVQDEKEYKRFTKKDLFDIRRKHILYLDEQQALELL